jgi:predicted CXXCH cytochrome family protein
MFRPGCGARIATCEPGERVVCGVRLVRLRAISRAALPGRNMTLLQDTTKKHGLLVVSLLATMCASVLNAQASSQGHPVVAAGPGCVTARCHARLLGAASGVKDGSTHPPAAGGDCGACHDLALAPETRFVRGASAAREPENSRAWDLELCTGCHGPAPAVGDLPGTATGFADGARNLHTLHVQAGRGRRCLTCHEPHAARQPKLLRERIPARGSAQVTQEFRGRPDGGWCRAGCHAPKSYRR